MGHWRLLLALLVAVSHLWSFMLPGPAAYAVWGFFVLSGFLMCLVLQEKYGFGRQGLLRYGLQRFLRIFPSFWLASLLGAVALIWVAHASNHDPRALNPGFGLPQSLPEWGFLATLLPVFPRWNGPVPVANALSIEVGFYLLMPLMAARRWLAWIGLLAGSAWAASYGFSVASFADRYALFWPCAPAFALGALLCHYRQQLVRWARPELSVTVWLLHSAFWLLGRSWPWSFGLYVSALLSAWVVISLYSTEHRPWPGDRLAGELSYPIYLLHTTAGAVLLPWFGTARSALFAVLALLLTLLASWAMVLLLERPISNWKRALPAPAADPAAHRPSQGRWSWLKRVWT
nr:acyltransferase [Pseudomarimonas arenosa]